MVSAVPSCAPRSRPVDLVAATARQPEQLADLSAEYGDSIHPIALDVTDAAAARAAITEARERLGRWT